jgi:[glutamine synthetase] adenylyltransferase / [glutamine synthetase]-adenylyl-L-tyrosine phosphorylase
MKSAFSHPEAAGNGLQRLLDLTGIELPLDFFSGAASPDQALLNLERWLSATSSPGLQLQQILDDPELGRLLILLLGASQPLADSLIQNPELASLVFDRSELAAVPSRASVIEQGRALLRGSTSYSHSLDRLRFLRQRWMLPIVVNDLARSWDEQTVWRALSEVAEALVALALEVVWEDQKLTRAFDGDCPIMVIGFGKLGGGELNYSSDIDLVYVFRDGGEEMRLSRVCEALNRALTERMGRGPLYRVDLRLRPFGGTGPIVCSMRSIESYYDLYAEPWEVQALLRSKPVAGPPELVERWEAIRAKHCFRAKLPAEAIESSLEMRARTEHSASADDIKRGAGGIRDVEFIVQILQLVHGYGKPSLQVRPTLEALNALEAEGILDHAVCQSLSNGYTFLRQLEHRIQFVDDQQAHTLPASDVARGRLAKLIGLNDWRDLAQLLGLHRRTIGSLYQSTLHPQAESSQDRLAVATALGIFSHSALQWFDVLPQSDAFYSSLVQNRDSLDRVRTIVQSAPRLVPLFKESVPLTELLLSGEIEEEFDATSLIEALPVDATPKIVAEVYSRAWTHLCAKWVLGSPLTRPRVARAPSPPEGRGIAGISLLREISHLADALIRHCAKRLYSEFDIIALGSLGLEDMTLDSDADVVLFVSSGGVHLDAETHAQFLLSLISQIKRLGAPIELDLRLRPEGGQGLLVRTYEGFSQYELEAMEMWERFALGQSRLLLGSEDALQLVLKAAYAQPLTPERLKELLAMKHRIETERVQPQHMRREVKLGLGGLADIEWFVHLHEMRYPTATKAGENLHMEDRIRALGRAQLINAVETDQLLMAREHLLTLRLRLSLQGLKKDLLPENPDKLQRLALASGFEEGNAFLAHHEQVIDTVRAIYKEGLERLKA